MLVPPSDTPRAASIMTTASSASAADKTGHTWSVAVTEDNCWDDLILTLGKYTVQYASKVGRQHAPSAEAVCASRDFPPLNVCGDPTLTGRQMVAASEATPAFSSSNVSCTKSPNANAASNATKGESPAPTDTYLTRMSFSPATTSTLCTAQAQGV